MWGSKVSLHRSKKSSDDSGYRSAGPSGALSANDQYYSKELRALPKSKHQDIIFSSKQRAYSKPRSASATSTRIPHLERPHYRTSSAATLLPSGQSSVDRDTNNRYYHPPSPDVSPPDTPGLQNRGLDSRGSSQISPIEEEPPGQMEAKFASLPVMRGDARRGPSRDQSSSLPSRRSRGTRWDDYSGEPTSSASGKAGQTAPGNMPFSSRQADRVINWGKELQPKKKFAEVRSRMSISKQSDDMSISSPILVSHESWKGPNGRASIGDPIYEKPGERSASRLQHFRSSDRLREDSSSPDPITRLQPSVVTTITADQPALQKRFFPNRGRAPSGGTNARPSVFETFKNTAPPRVELPESDFTSSLAELKMTDDEAPVNNEQLYYQQPNSDQPDRSLSVSRSSAATDAPSTRASTPGSMPGNRDGPSQSNENLASIMSRKRPVTSTVAPGKKQQAPVRKPTPSQAAMQAAVKGEDPPERQQQPPPLPPPPKDRLEALQERGDYLWGRRANIETIIHELNHVFNPTATGIDESAKTEVQETIKCLSNELADIKSEEHEVGLLIYRAWKKRDDGGGGLWVNRIGKQ